MISHTIFAAINYIYMIKYEWSAIWIVLCILWTCIILIQLSHDWFFVKVDLSDYDEEQR